MDSRKRFNHQAVVAGFAGRRSVLEYALHPLAFPTGGLVPVFARGGVRVYTQANVRHHRPPFRAAAGAWLPRGLREPSDLSCAQTVP